MKTIKLSKLVDSTNGKPIRVDAAIAAKIDRNQARAMGKNLKKAIKEELKKRD